jgi:hypothetical protein
MLAGWIAAAASLSVGTGNAGPLGETTVRMAVTAGLSQAAPADVGPRDKSQQVGDLLRRARRAMAEDDLEAAESLISAAEDLGVRYSLLHVGDTPKRARRDLQRKLSTADKYPSRSGRLFSPLPSKGTAPPADPFAARSGSFPAAKLAERGGPTAELRVLGGERSGPAIGTGLPGFSETAALPRVGEANSARPLATPRLLQLPPPGKGTPGMVLPDGDLTRLPAILADAGTAAPTAPSMTDEASSESLLLRARRALAIGDVRQATNLVHQAKLQKVSYAPLDDTPERVEAAIRQYQAVTARPNQTETQRRRKVRMLMGQAEVLLRYGDCDQAEQLATRASREKITYGLFETRPQDLLGRIAAARRQGNPSATSSAPGTAVAISGDAGGPSPAAQQRAAALVREARAALEAGQLARAETLARQADQLHVPGAAYARGEDRPSMVLLDVRRARLRDQSGVIRASGQFASPATGTLPVDHTASRALYDPSNDPTVNVRAAHQQPDLPGFPRPTELAQRTPTLAPAEPIPTPEPPSPLADPNAQDGPSLIALGEAALRTHDTQAAYQYFRQAASHMGELDPVSRQRLQERLQLLSMPRTNASDGEPTGSIVDQAAAQQQALARKVYADIAHQAANAQAMLQTDPKGALALLEEARAAVEVAYSDTSIAI